MFQQIEFLRLGEKRILLVIVGPTGDVQNRMLLTDVDYSPSQLVHSANYINQNYGGLSLDDILLDKSLTDSRLRSPEMTMSPESSAIASLPASTASYVSGLLIGAEWHDILAAVPSPALHVRLIGSPALAQRHLAAAALLDCTVTVIDPQQAFVAALRHLAPTPE